MSPSIRSILPVHVDPCWYFYFYIKHNYLSTLPKIYIIIWNESQFKSTSKMFQMNSYNSIYHTVAYHANLLLYMNQARIHIKNENECRQIWISRDKISSDTKILSFEFVHLKCDWKYIVSVVECGLFKYCTIKFC